MVLLIMVDRKGRIRKVEQRSKDGMEDPRRKKIQPHDMVVPVVPQGGTYDDQPMPEELMSPPQTTVRRLAEVGIDALDHRDYKGTRQVLVKLRDREET